MTVIFKCQANPLVGMGHLVRSRVLARALKAMNVDSVMVGPEITYKHRRDDLLFKDWVSRPEWRDTEIEISFITSIAHEHSTNRIIMDDYRSDGQCQLALRERDMVILQQYDASKHQEFAAQLVINSSPAEKRAKYEDHLLAHPVTMLHGPTYAILRTEFLHGDLPIWREDCTRILVSFGGGDDRGAILFTLKALYNYLPQSVSLQLMVGASNSNIADIKLWITQHQDMQVELHIDPVDVPGLMKSCDLAVLSGGTTTFEAAYCGLPMILMPIVSNQLQQGLGWEELGAAKYLGPFHQVTVDTVREAVILLSDAADRRKNMAKIGKKAIDGKGVKRILNNLLKYRI